MTHTWHGLTVVNLFGRTLVAHESGDGAKTFGNRTAAQREADRINKVSTDAGGEIPFVADVYHGVHRWFYVEVK